MMYLHLFFVLVPRRVPSLPAYLRAASRLTSFLCVASICSVQVAGLIFSVAVLAHSAKNQSACIEGFVALEGLYCVLQFPLSCAFVTFSQERAARRGAPRPKTA